MSRYPPSEDGDAHPLLNTGTQLTRPNQHDDGNLAVQGPNYNAQDMDMGPRFPPPYGTRFQLRRTNDTLDIFLPRESANGGMIATGIFVAVWYSFLVMWCSIAIQNGAYGMLLFSILHWVVGLVPLYVLLWMLADTHVHIDTKAYHIIRWIGGRAYFQREKRGSFEHLYQAAVTRTTRQHSNYQQDIVTTTTSFGVTLHEGVIQQSLDVTMVELEAQWIAAEVNAFLAELKGLPALVPNAAPHFANIGLMPQPLPAMDQAPALGVPVLAPM